MRDRWYSDKRDLVKWAALVHLAQESRASTIVQVAFYKSEPATWRLKRNDKHLAFPSVIQEHFRRLKNIAGLATAARIQVRVYDSAWPGSSREHYIEDVIRELHGFGTAQFIAFLDPDTGIAPKNSGTSHVRHREVKAIFDALKPRDWLAFYQHAWRRPGWIRITRRRFASATGVPGGRVLTFSCKDVAKDVVLFAIEKA